MNDLAGYRQLQCVAEPAWRRTRAGTCPVCDRSGVWLGVVNWLPAIDNVARCLDCTFGPPLDTWGWCLSCEWQQPWLRCELCGAMVSTDPRITSMYHSICRCCRQPKPRRGGRRFVEDGVEHYVCSDCKQKHLEPIIERQRQELAAAVDKMFHPLFHNN